jgi:hypothetical protein
MTFPGIELEAKTSTIMTLSVLSSFSKVTDQGTANRVKHVPSVS